MIFEREDLPDDCVEVLGRYLISRDARIFDPKSRNVKTENQVWEKLTDIAPSGSERVYIWIGKKQTQVQLQVLVALAFLPPRPSPEHLVGHINGNRSDNRVENLEWVHQDTISNRFWGMKLRKPLDLFSE